MLLETGWQSITDKEGSTASGAVLTVKGSGAALLAKGSNRGVGQDHMLQSLLMLHLFHYGVSH